MQEAFKAIRVSERVWWVGAIDWAARSFHGYQTNRGTTYNAYLIVADRVALVDCVKATFVDEMMARIRSVPGVTKVDCLISNHSEPDHSGELPGVIEMLKPSQVLASSFGVKTLQRYHGSCAITAVKDGESVDLGGVEVRFAETRMVHWPDSMVSYVPQERLLISQDMFGMHLASHRRFADENEPHILNEEAARYYANILLPQSPAVAKALEKLAATGWTYEVIAPDHGPIWRRNASQIVERYASWVQQPRTNKAIVVYDTMWKSTDLMARAIGEGLAAGGAGVRLMPLGSSHRSDIATEVLDAGALLVGAPTLNNDMFPAMADVLTYLRGLKPKGLIGASFGSYGWSGEAARTIHALLEEMKVEMVAPPLRVQYAPAEAEVAACYQLGLLVAQKLRAKATATQP